MNLRKANVSALVKQAQDGDEHAMSELITTYKGLIYTVAFRMLGDPDIAEDICQETFIKAFIKIKTVKKRERFRTWVCSVARNLVYDYLRKRKQEKTLSIEEIGEQCGPSDIKKKHREIIIQNALAKLSERDRLLITLSYYKGFSLAEISDITKIPKQNIRVFLHRARLRLREHLKGRENELLSIQ